ncbi:Hypothetical protein PHPALM_36136 [Phytophthora palmivora]|uniref:Tf2-1-like SH3-like domain-containing protein n=1 Tax=Phytophthora palmivora TaxID=4796 RepID=A0A2P4X0R0_9STRA|nr:Hypothetical protein PHPALM_36136 [Phytophthora palmivora]
MIGIHDDGDIGSSGTINKFDQRLREAISDRADLHNQEIRPHQIEVGSRVWLYLDRVKEGYAKKLAHLWHGPFRVIEKVGEHAVKLEIAGSGYHIFPMVHVNKLKLVKEYPDRPLMRLNVESQDHLNCGALLHEFLRDRTNRNRFGVMQSHEEP